MGIGANMGVKYSVSPFILSCPQSSYNGRKPLDILNKIILACLEPSLSSFWKNLLFERIFTVSVKIPKF